jgi:transglutaminase-like putative cysteine protease
VTLLAAGALALVAAAAAAPAGRPEDLREVRIPRGTSARADYVAWREGRSDLALPAHEAAGWTQRVRLRPDGRTALTVAVLAERAPSFSPWPRREPLPPDVAPWLPELPGDPEIAALAEEIAHGATTQAEVSERILAWVSTNVAHRDDPGHADTASASLETRLGSCVGRSLLARELLRAAGIPARTVHGLLAADDGSFRLHRFVESWVEGSGWLPSDPGRSVHVVDERHVVVALDDSPYDPESQRSLVLRPASRPARLHDLSVEGARALVVRESGSPDPDAKSGP